MIRDHDRVGWNNGYPMNDSRVTPLQPTCASIAAASSGEMPSPVFKYDGNSLSSPRNDGMDFFEITQSGFVAAAAAGNGCNAASVDAKADAATVPCDEEEAEVDASAPVLGRAYAETGVMGTTSVGDERSSSPTNRAVGRRGCADANDDADDDCAKDDDAPNGMLVAGRCAPATGENKTLTDFENEKMSVEMSTSKAEKWKKALIVYDANTHIV